MNWSILYRYARAIKLRAELFLQLAKSNKEGFKLPKGLRSRIWKEPHNHEEYIWLLRFFPVTDRIRLIDIGGNSGYWSEDFMQYYSQTRTYAFEPVNEMFEQYKARFSHNPDVNVFHTALGETVEQKRINVAKGYGLTSFNTYSESLADRNSNFEKQINVSVDRLDNFIVKIDFNDDRKTIIKVDVQGFETKVVIGGMEVFSYADAVIMECSFVNEFKEELPTFGDLVTLLRKVDLHPIQFGIFDYSRARIAYERNVLFVKSKYFSKIWN